MGCKLRDFSVNDIYSELKWMKVGQRAIYFRNTLMYRCIHDLAPNYLTSNINLQSNMHTYSTRSSTMNNISLPSVRTESAKKSFAFSGPGSWNNLPHNLKILSNFNTFKAHLKHYLLNYDA